MSILDEECNFPKGSDQSFLEKLEKNFKASKVFKKPLRTQGVFVIVHFAGEVLQAKPHLLTACKVTYDTTGFLNKNKDTIHGDLIALMQKSSDPFVQTLFPQEQKSKDGKLAPGKVMSPAAAAAAARPGNTAAKKVTLGAQFREQLISLMNIISSTEPHFIRAIKPNNYKKANSFDSVNALRQLRYSGLLETVKVRSAGFSYRPTYQECFQKFKILAKNITTQTKGMDSRKACELLLFEHLKLDKSKIQFGQTKLFMKEQEVRS